MTSVESVQSLVSPYGAAEPFIQKADAAAGIVESLCFDSLSSKYELLPCHRPTLKILVDSWLHGDVRAFDPEFPSTDKEINTVLYRTYDKRCELKDDAQQFFLNTSEECLAKKRCYAREMPDMPSPDATAQFLGLLDDSPGLVLGEVHSHVGARKLLIENMPALKEQGVERLYLEHLLTDVHGDALAELNGSPHHPISPDVARYLRAQVEGWRPVCKVDPAVAEKYSYTAVVDAARRAGISVIPIDCAASYFLEGGEGYVNDSEAWRIPVMNYFSYLVVSETNTASNRVSRHGQSDKWIALVGNMHVSVFDGVPGLSELMGVPGVRFEDALENCFDVDAGLEIHYPACFLGDKKHSLMKGDFIFKVDVREADVWQAEVQQAVVQQAEVEQKTTSQRPSFLSRALDYLSCYPRFQRA